MIIAIFIVAGIYMLFLSEGGYLERQRLKSLIHTEQKRLEYLSIERERLQQQKNQYSNDRVEDDDLIHSGIIKDGNKIVVIKDRMGKDAINAPAKTEESGVKRMTLYRIIFVTFSITLLSVLYLMRQKSNEE